jgi:transcriptional regulator with PAS, ATPase and Fis domain
MVGFPNICQGAETVSSLLDFEIPIYSVAHESEVRTALQTAFANGAQMILGDVVTVKTAQEMGHHGILVTSGRESVSDALGEVRHAFDLYRRGQEHVQLYEKVLEHVPSGVLVVDAKGIIRYANRNALQFVGGKHEGRSVVGQPLESQCPAIGRVMQALGVDTEMARKEIVQVEDRWLQLEIVSTHLHQVNLGDRQAIHEATEAGFEYLLYLQPIENGEVRALADETKQVRLATFAHFMGTSPALQVAIERAKTFASVEQQVWLSGPFGSGRCKFAQAIHAASKRSGERFDVLHVQTMDELELAASLFGTEEAPGLLLTSNGTIYLAEIDQLSTPMQERLLHVLQKGTLARLIVSSTRPLAEIRKAGVLVHDELSFLLGELYLKVPALVERIEDIDPISRVLIAEHNSQYGKHIVGMRNEVLERLKQHSWPGNVKELETVMGELLLLTNGHYVGREELEAVWERYELPQTVTPVAGDGQQMNIDLSGTWEEIEQRILKQVLEEEGMNQSRAAKRLGLNRSTLWRKMRD